MGAVIRTRLIKVGNSQGIRIPKPLLEQSGIDSEVEIEVNGNHLIVRPAAQSRSGWDEAFATMAEQQDDILLCEENMTNWDRDQWEW
jgi:antitoxin MazE